MPSVAQRERKHLSEPVIVRSIGLKAVYPVGEAKKSNRERQVHEMEKKEKSTVFIVFYILFIVFTFPIWILFYVMKAMK